LLTVLNKSAFDVVKPQMQIRTENIKSQLKHLEKRENQGSYVDCTKVNRLEMDLKIYSVKYVLPVKIGGLIINYKLLTDFLKKIKKFDVDFRIEDGNLIVEYSQIKGNKGILHLGDLTPYYRDFHSIPLVELKQGVLHGA
jgi:hypothetical protein